MWLKMGQKGAENSPSISTIRNQRAAYAILVAAVPVNHTAGVAVCSAAGAVRRVAVQPRRRARRLARNRAVPKLAHAVSAKVLAGAALPIRVAAVAPDSGTLLVAVLLAALAGGGEDRVPCACAFVTSPVCTVLSGCWETRC